MQKQIKGTHSQTKLRPLLRSQTMYSLTLFGQDIRDPQNKAVPVVLTMAIVARPLCGHLETRTKSVLQLAVEGMKGSP